MSLDWEARPWGSWHVLDVDEGYKVKRIHVNPGERLSYQSHEHRSEHWVVLVGTATAIIDGAEVTAHAGESINVPCGAKHRLANNGDVELVIIEVQRGHYTGEDDIVRYHDDYGRPQATIG
ncbi:MAG: phosphomannose isomerase type II C-terminal cupin domain [Nocardioidaceae bacterium]